MASRARVRRPSPLSCSLPDVSFMGLAPQAPPPLVISPTRTAAVKYNIDDDAWADKVDRATGSVFYVETPPIHYPHTLREESPQPRSSSSSSLSSGPSIPDLPLPSPSSLYPPHGSPSLSERFTQSLSLYSEMASSPSSDERMHIPATASLGAAKGSSLRRRLKKAVRGRLRRVSEGRNGGISQSGSVPDLGDFYMHPSKTTKPHKHSRRISDPTSSPTLSIPHGALYGSRGLPLHDTARTCSVRINLTQYKLGEGRNRCSLEALGIVPTRSLGRSSKFGSFSNLRLSFKHNYPGPVTQHPVVIRGVAPASPAALTQQIHEGDTILAVNKQLVDLETIDTVLARLSNEILLVVRKHHHHLAPSLLSPPPFPPPHLPSGLSRLVGGSRDTIRSHTRHLLRHPHVLLYLTLDTREEDPVDKDVLYHYPSDSREMGKLLQLRGLFLTLSDVLGSITGATSSCSTILLDNQLIHVGYVQYGKELLLLAMPAKFVSQYQVQLLVQAIERTLQLLYNSVHRAFLTADNHSSLDHLFSLFFERLLSPSEPNSSSPLMGLPAVPQLKLPSEIKVKLSAALGGLDSADHSDRTEILHMRRPFLLTGTCMLYRGALVCSHMREEELRDVVVFCDAYRLLELTASESVNQIIIWREVYLSSSRQPLDQTDPVYTERRGRTFLLIVGLEHVLLCLLMERSPASPSPSPSMVDEVYIDRARALILEMKAQDLLSNCEEKALLSTPLPALISADVALASLFTASSARQRKVSHQISKDGSDSDEGAYNSPQIGKKHSSLSSILKPTFRSRKLSLPSFNHRRGSFTAARPSYTLTAGLENLLLHYVSLDTGRGVMVCPTHAEFTGSAHAHLLRCFHHASLAVREVLRGRVTGDGEGEEGESEDESDWGSEEEEEEEEVERRETPATPPFFNPLPPVLEHGMLLQCSVQHSGPERSKILPTLNYWVVGRLFPDTNQEFYVCFQDNTSQNVVEMAFRLLFGTPR